MGSFRQKTIAEERARAAFRNLLGVLRRIGALSFHKAPVEGSARLSGWQPMPRRKAKDFSNAALRILAAVGRGNKANAEIPQEALDTIKRALNGKVLSLAPKPPKRHRRPQVFVETPLGEMGFPLGGEDDDLYESGITLREGNLEIKVDPIRYAAQLLIEYLALISISKAVHTSCKLEDCNAIVFGGRGNKRFCSEEHRVKYWDYNRKVREYPQG